MKASPGASSPNVSSNLAPLGGIIASGHTYDDLLLLASIGTRQAAVEELNFKLEISQSRGVPSGGHPHPLTIMTMKWLKHAFAVDAPGAAEPTERQRMIVEKICVELVRRHLTVPARLMLEMWRPLNYVSAQLLHFFQPIAAIIATTDEYEAFTKFLEQRGSIEYMSLRLEAACVARERDADPSRLQTPPRVPKAHDAD